mgnify:CR=1 FL=1
MIRYLMSSILNPESESLSFLVIEPPLEAAEAMIEVKLFERKEREESGC